MSMRIIGDKARAFKVVKISSVTHINNYCSELKVHYDKPQRPLTTHFLSIVINIFILNSLLLYETMGKQWVYAYDYCSNRKLHFSLLQISDNSDMNKRSLIIFLIIYTFCEKIICNWPFQLLIFNKRNLTLKSWFKCQC